MQQDSLKWRRKMKTPPIHAPVVAVTLLLPWQALFAEITPERLKKVTLYLEEQTPMVDLPYSISVREPKPSTLSLGRLRTKLPT